MERTNSFTYYQYMHALHTYLYVTTYKYFYRRQKKIITDEACYCNRC